MGLHASKTKKMVLDFRREKQKINYIPLRIYGTPIEKVSSYRYLGVHISENLTWTTCIFTLVKKARWHLYHLKWLRKFKISMPQKFSHHHSRACALWKHPC